MMWWRRKRERELEREIRAHLELEAEEQREAGLPPGEARHAAQRWQCGRSRSATALTPPSSA